MSRERPTIADVARRAGVSVGTASNVFNGKGKHTESTCARVRKAAAELHFTPNALIRSLQKGKTNTIGALTWGIPGEPEAGDIGSLLLKGISDGIAESGYDMLLYMQHTDPAPLRPAAFLDGRVDGLIVRPGGLSFDDLAALGSSRMPTVVIYEQPLPEGVGYITIDNAGGVAEVMDHLVSLGHRRIAFYAPAGPFDFVERLRGYREGLARHGIAHDQQLEYLTNREYRDFVGVACDLFLSG
ncbi:MAG TPA: LacI family DNA-binding transcriptional regulator, partial [Chthonomonadales bacterium]|nr:LacI family DNA-binding transcriptional regulator [Chthonomonadales bacterium]